MSHFLLKKFNLYQVRSNNGPSLDEMDEWPSGLDGLQHDVTDAMQQESVVSVRVVRRLETFVTSGPSHVTLLTFVIGFRRTGKSNGNNDQYMLGA